MQPISIAIRHAIDALALRRLAVRLDDLADMALRSAEYHRGQADLHATSFAAGRADGLAEAAREARYLANQSLSHRQRQTWPNLETHLDDNETES